MISKSLLTLFSLCALTCCITQTQAANIYVDAAAVGANNGTSWVDAYTNIHDAVADSNAMAGADNIYVASGYYVSTAPYVFTDAATFTGGMLYGFPTTLENVSGASPIMEVQATDLDVSRTDFRNSMSHIVASVSGIRFNKCHFQGAMNGSVVARWCWLVRGAQCGFYDNRSVWTAGGIMAEDCDLVHIEQCKFQGNITNAYGGAIQVNNPSSMATGVLGGFKCENSTFTRNAAARAGGAIAARLTTSKLANSVFHKNHSRFGGAIALACGPTMNAEMYMVNCTIFGNAARIAGGGMMLFDWGAHLVQTEIHNSILWRNWAPPAPVLMKQVNRPPNIFTHSCVDGWGSLPWPGMANFPWNPNLMPNGDVLPFSPCVDSGAPGVNPTMLDITMAPRVQGPSIDIGAFEQ
ncbi:MAG: hypothetical protein GY922_11255 [Proteobacteria bacterium]|nr:hypothetical protein [Pseudomonadota bacterium]